MTITNHSPMPSYIDLEKRIKLLESQKDTAYFERNLLVLALSKVFPSHLMKHAENESWEDDWRNIVCIHIPTFEKKYGDQRNIFPEGTKEIMQVTWHIHISEVKNFSHLKMETNHYDGHTTEEKYRRLMLLNLV